MKNFFYINQFRVDPEINTITGNGESYKMEPKIMQVLMCLVNAKGNVVSKQSLFETVWAETIVVEMVLTRAISELRRVFGDKPTDPKFISTISKSGYCLIAEVSKREPENRRRRVLKVAVPLVSVAALFITVFGFLQSDPLPSISTTPFTSDKGWEYHPSLSAKGDWVAYVSSKANQNTSDIFLKSIASDSLVKLTKSDGYYLKPVWSPDEKLIATFGNREGKGGIHIFSVSDGSLVRSVDINTQYVGMAWCPSGEKISYVAFDTSSARHSVYKYSLQDSTSELQVASALDSWGDSNPRYSPDGKSLAFLRTVSEGDQDIYKLDLETSSLSRLTKINKNILGFDWEDESTLLISSDLDGGDNLWKLNVNSKNNPATLERIVRIPYGESIQNPVVRNGLLIGEKWMKDTDIIISNFNRPLGEDSMVLNSSQWDLHPDISRDGREVVFCSNRSGSYEIWKYRFEDQSIHQLTNLKKGFSGKPKWSPDGQLIAFESNESGSHQIYVVEADGGNMRKVTNADGDYINPSWSRDGSFVYCSSNIDGDWSIWAQSLANRRLRKIHSSGGYFLQEAYGFGRAFITRLHRDGIWELKMDGTEERIIHDLNSGDWGSWKVGTEGIYYFNRQKNQICHYDFATGEISNLLQIKGNVPINDPSFAIGENGGIILYGQLRSYSGDLVAIRNY
ncbi:MAG: winged helix-turn-helix domain-containing protein [Cyclobacteriaceae bacterium]